MPLLAAATTTADRLTRIPLEFWVRMGLAIVVLVGVVIALRKIAKVNKVVLTVVVGLLVTIIGFNWIYERNEPAWASPVVGWLADFFPTKGMYAGK
jgi:apolipoprotein N-acyltransferase